jgi:hypothetical protein
MTADAGSVPAVRRCVCGPAPDLGYRAATEHIRGLLPVGDRMLVLLNIDRLIGGKLPGTSMNEQETACAAVAA